MLNQGPRIWEVTKIWNLTKIKIYTYSCNLNLCRNIVWGNGLALGGSGQGSLASVITGFVYIHVKSHVTIHYFIKHIS